MFPTFYLPAGGARDDYFGEVVLLLRGEGSNGSTSFIDYSSYANPATANGGIQMDTGKMRNGRPSIKIDGTSDWLRFNNDPEFAIGLNDFTIEAWLWFDSFPGSGAGLADHMSQFQSHPASAWEIYFDTYPTFPAIRFSSWANSANSTSIDSGATAFPTGQWAHFALNKTGNAARMYFDGVQVGFTNPGSAWGINTNVSVPFYVGGFGLYSTTGTMNGWMSEFRWTIGHGRYPSAFTPPTDDFPLQ